MKKYFSAAMLAAVIVLGAAPASEAFLLTEGSFGSPDGVHSSTNADQTGNTVYGTVGIGGSLVTFTSTDTLFLNGAGEAIIDGNPLHDLDVLFEETFLKVTYDIETETRGPGAYTLIVNKGLANAFTFNVPSVPLGLGALGNGANKYIVSATGSDTIKNLGFVFTPAVDDLKQFRLLA